MIGTIVRITLFVIVLNHFFTPCIALRGSIRGSSATKYGSKGYQDPAKPTTFLGTSSGVPGQKTTRRGLGLSAWGIIVTIITLILAGMGFYYFTMCYPLLCKKERKYDII